MLLCSRKVSNRKSIRPFSQYSMNEIRQKQGVTDKENFGFVGDSETANKADDGKAAITNGHDPNAAAWYKDVIELRKKAGEYKVKREEAKRIRCFLFNQFSFLFIKASWMGS